MTEAKDKKVSRQPTAEAQEDRREKDLAARVEKANETANQTTDEGNKFEVQGKLEVPHVEVIKRGQVKYTDDNGNLVKKLTDAPIDEDGEDRPKPDYLVLHEKVLNGANPLEAQRAFKPEKETVREGNMEDVEDTPRTGNAELMLDAPVKDDKNAK